MENLDDIKNLISEAKNICVIPLQTNEPESLPAALALFYTLRELHKNVNLIAGDVPEKFNFLVPPLDFISQPKNFVISIPKNVAEISQVYYEKNEDDLKIHLTIDRGNIKKDNISFYFSDAKPDLIITLGIKDFKKELENKLDSFGFLLDSPIINIDGLTSLTVDNALENTKFGKINAIEEESLPEAILEIIKALQINAVDKNTANSLLTGLVIHYENFQHQDVTPETFELCARLMRQGANHQQIIANIYPSEKPTPHFATEKPFGATQGKPLDIVTS